MSGTDCRTHPHVAFLEREPAHHAALRELFRDHARIDVFTDADSLINSSNRPTLIACGCGAWDDLERLRPLSTQTPMIVYSQQGAISQAVLSMRLGARDYLDHIRLDSSFRCRVLAHCSANIPVRGRAA